MPTGVCPNCAARHDVPAVVAGLPIKCVSCGVGILHVEGYSKPASSAPTPPPAAQPAPVPIPSAPATRTVRGVVIPDAEPTGTIDWEKTARAALALAVCGVIALVCWFVASQGRTGGDRLSPAEMRDLQRKADAEERSRWAQEEWEHNRRVKEDRDKKEEEYRKKYPIWARACQAYVLDRLSMMPPTDVFTRNASAVKLVKEFEKTNPMPLSPHEDNIRSSTGILPATEWPLRPLPPGL